MYNFTRVSYFVMLYMLTIYIIFIVKLVYYFPFVSLPDIFFPVK